MSETVEAVTFKLVKGSQPANFVAANGTINEWLRKQPGFLSRNLSQLEDNSWLDIVHWKTAVNAKQAADKIMVDLGDCECMGMIDPETIKMSHGELRLEI